MSFFELLDSTFCVHLTLTLAHFLWQGVVIAVFAALASLCLRGGSAQSRYLIHVAALLLMVACLPVTFAVVYATVSESAPLPPEVEDTPPADVAIAETAMAPPAEVFEPPAEGFEPPLRFADPRGNTVEPPPAPQPTEAEPAAPEEEPVAAAEAGASIWETLAPYASGAYVAGVLAMLVRLWLALQGGYRLRRRSHPVDDPGLLAIVKQQARLLGLRLVPVVAYCERVAVPVVVGVLRPMILLPVSLGTGLTPDQLKAILTHELTHLRRYDHLVNVLQRFVEAVLFFHPVAWYVSRRVNVEREHCCDDLVVATGHTRCDYAESLIRVAELSLAAQASGRSYSRAALGASGGSRSRLQERILRVIDGRSHEKIRLWRTWPVAFVLIAAALVATSLLMNVKAEPAEPQEIGPAADAAAVPLAEALEDKDEDVRTWAAEALSKIVPSDKKAISALIGALDDKKLEVRYHAAVALGRIGPEAKEAIPALSVMLRDEGEAVQIAAARALKAIRADDDAARKNRDGPKLPPHFQVRVKVPESVQKRLRQHVASLCIGVYPNAKPDLVREDCEESFLQEEYLVRVAQAPGPEFRFTLENTGIRVSGSFPDGQVLALGTDRPPPGVVLKNRQHALEIEEAKRVADGVVTRLGQGFLGKAELAVVKSGYSQPDGTYYFEWREKTPKHLRHCGRALQVEVRKKDGLVVHVRATSPVEAPRIPLEQAVENAKNAVANSDHGFSEDRVYLDVQRFCSKRRLVWCYEVPPPPMGSPQDVNWWDAVTGRVLYSEVVSGGTEKRPYRDPDFFAVPTESSVRRDIEQRTSFFAVEDSVQRKEAADLPWGKPVRGVQVRLRADRIAWSTREVPVVKVDLRNNGKEEFWLIGWMVTNCYAHIDGVTYLGGCSAGCPAPGNKVTGIPVKLAGSATIANGFSRVPRSSVSGEGDLHWSPGKHVVRVSFRMKPRGAPDKAPHIEVFSNPVEIEIVSGEEDQPVGPKASTRRGPVHASYPGSRFPLGQVIKDGFAFVAVCESTGDAAVTKVEGGVYEAVQEFKLKELLAGERPTGKVVKLHYSFTEASPTERAIEKPGFVIWVVRKEGKRFRGIKAVGSSVAHRATVLKATRTIVGPKSAFGIPHFKALVAQLRKTIPKTWELEVPAEGDVRPRLWWDGGGVLIRMRPKASRPPGQQNTLGTEVSVWVMDKDYYYLSAPWISGTHSAGTDEAEALELTRWHGHRVFFSAKAETEKDWREYLANVKTALITTEQTCAASPGTQPAGLNLDAVAKMLTEKVEEPLADAAVWGKPVEGVQARLRRVYPEWKQDTVARLIADVRNEGQRDLTVAQAQELCELEIDGRRYRWAGHIDVKSSWFPPGRQYKGIWIDLNDQWKCDDEPLALKPGKHSVRVWFVANPAEKDGGKPVRFATNSVEIVPDDNLAVESLKKLGWMPMEKGNLVWDSNGRVSNIDLFGPSPDVPVTDAWLMHLKGMSKLRSLFLANTQITDAGLAHLRGLTNLRELRLQNTRIGDAGLAHLSGLTKLEWLELPGTQVSDAGLDHLSELAKLKKLDLRDTHVTEEGVKKLTRALPNVIVDCDSISWGKPKDGIVCGLSVGRKQYVLGQRVVLAVYLKNTREKEVTCDVSRVHGAWVRGPRDRELYMMVDALGGREVEGKRHTIPAGEVRRILVTECPTRPTGNRASDLHFTPGRTRAVVRCTPLFDKTGGGIFADKDYGACTGAVTVEVVEPPGQDDGPSPRAPSTPSLGKRVNTQKTLVKLVGKQFTDWTYPSDLLPDTFAGLEHVSGPGDPGLSPKAAWRKPITLKHGPSGTEVFVNCYRRREEPAQPRDPNLPGTPSLPLTEPDYRYQSAEFHALKAAAAREKSRDVFVFLDGDILFKVELSGGSPELRLKLVRSTAEAIWKFRHREDVATIRGIFRPTKEEFFSDEPLTVEMVVHNDAVEDFRFDTGGDYRFGNGRHDRFFVTFGDPNAKYISIGGGLHGLGIVPAKGVYKEVIDLTPWSPPGPDDQGIIRVTCRRTLTTRVATKLLVDCLEKQPIDYTRKDARAVLIVKMTRLNQHRAGFADERDKQKEIERVVDSYMRFPQIQSTFECSVSGRVTSAEAATGTAEQRPGQPGRVSSEVASWLRDLRSDVPGKRLEAIRKLGNWDENGTDHSEALYGEDPAARRLAAARLDASGRQEITGALLDRLERNVENRTGYEDGSVSVTREGIHRTVRVESENEALANALRQLGVTRAVPLLKRAHSFQLERQPAEERPDTMPGTFAFCIYMLSMERVDVWENGKLKSFQPGPVLEEQARQLLRPDLKPTRGLTASLWVSSASRYPKFFVGDATLVAVLTVTNHSDQPIPADLSPETITFSCVDSGGQRVNIPATDMVKPVVGLAPQTLAPKGSATCTWHLKPLKDSALGRPMKRGYVSLKAVYAPRNETVRKQWGSGPLVSNTLTRPYFDNTRPDSPWHLLQKGNLVTVDVERALYEKPGEPHFFIRVRLTNVTDRPVGVDLRDYSKVVYPNQWGPANVDYRRAINERRRPHEPLDDAARAKLLADFRDGKLTVIPAGRAVDYYREFNGSGRADVDKQVAKYKYLIVSLDGALRLTDGTQVEQISCSWDRTDDSRTALVIATPVPWKTIPAGAEVKAASKEIAGGKPSAERTDSRTPLAMPRTVPVAEDVTIREGHRTRYVWRGAEWKPVELLDGWDQQRLWKALSEHVTAEATPRLSGCTFQTNENTFTVFCKSPEYETLKKPEGVDPAKVKTVGPVVGPDKDGLILRLQWQNDHTRHPKPRLFDRGPWRDLYAEVHLPTTSACIGVRVGYGPETDARLIQHLVAPSRWLRSIGAIAQRAPQPAGPKSQPSTTKNAPTTVRGSSPLARKLADSMLAGWGLTKSGHCHAPAEWSGKTDCEYLEFTHDTLKSSLDDISRAAFNVWLTPRDYAGRRLPTMDDQPGGAWLFGQSRDHLLFFEVPPDVPKETAIRLHSVWKVSRQNPQGIAAGWAGGDGLLRQ